MPNEYAATISREMNLGPRQAGSIVRLFNEGATIPFMARYRKEATGGLDERALRNIQLRLFALQEMDKRREFILSAIDGAGALTPDLRERIESATDPVQLEDIYQPYRPKKRTRAQAARDRGLEPLAKILMNQDKTNLKTIAKPYIKVTGDPDTEVPDADNALAGASDIIAEWVSESEKARVLVRQRYQRSAEISSRVAKGKEEEGANFRDYFEYKRALRLCPSHTYLAMRRGEDQQVLQVDISIPNDDETAERLTRMFVKQEATPNSAEFVRNAVRDSYKRLIKPSIVSELASLTKEKSDNAAIALFADNLKQILMTPPLGRKRILAIDPGHRHGCKCVCLDEQGELLDAFTVFPDSDYYAAADAVSYHIDRHNINVVAVGNGTASRDTVSFLQSFEMPHRVDIKTVSEQGASIYSASEAAIEEFPDLDIIYRGAVNIGRRLLDPLAELVKLDPKTIGVGQYQHDVNQTRLREALDYTVEACVNAVGVNVNTASAQLLSRVSGIGPKLAGYIVDYRRENGPFDNREQLLKVPRMGARTFELCAGFMRITGGSNPLDATAIHPERYALIQQMAEDMGVEVEKLIRNSTLLKNIETARYTNRKLSMATMDDIIHELEHPSEDPRMPEQEVEYDPGVRSINDLHVGMEVVGKVINLTAFGVFVDIGLHQNALLHISQLSDDYIGSAADVVRVGQPIRVRIIDIDAARGRIALSLKGVKQEF